jgi:DNA-binding Xre family transcriptional regulator
MAAHPEVIEEVLEKAKEENEVPYKAEIFKKIDECFKKPELKAERNLKKEEKRHEILSQLNLKDLGRNDHEHAICLQNMDRICLKLLPRLSKYELSMEELLYEIKFFHNKGETTFEIVAEQKPIKEFLGSCFTQDFIAILQAFGFKVEWPEGIPLSPRTNRFKRVKAQRKRMAYYSRKGKLWR